MIKINLLPKTINQKAILRNTALAFAFGLVAIIVGGVVFSMNLKTQVAAKEAEAVIIEGQKAQVEQLQTQATQVTSGVAPLQAKLDFIQAVLKYNQAYPELFTQVAKWTYQNVQYTSLTCDGTQVTMNAMVKNLDDLGRYMLNMYRATDLFTQVTISGVGGGQIAQAGAGGPGGMPGGPAYTPAMPSGSGAMAGIGAISAGVERAPSQQNWISFGVSCRLKTPIVAPAFSGTGWTGGTGQPGQPGQPAPMPMPTPAPATPAPAR